MIGNRHAIAGAYIVAALGGLTVVALALIAAALEVDRARRRELEERKAAFGELEATERERDYQEQRARTWREEAARLAAMVDGLSTHASAPEPEPETP